MKLTKKQWIIGGAVALVLAGGVTVGAVHHHNVQVEQAAQEAKRAYDSLMKEAKEATEKAETFKAEKDVESAQDAIKKLNEKDKTSLIVRVERVRQNWDIVNQVNKVVVNAEKVQNDANVKTAQTAINKLTDEMVKPKKAAFQKRLDKVKTAVKNNKERAKAKAEAEKKAKTASKTVDNSDKATKSEQSSTTTANQVTTASASANNVASTGNGVQVTPQTGGGSSQPVTPSPSPAPAPTPDPSPAPTPDPTPKPDPAPTPAETYTGWVRNKAGQIVWSQGGFKTLDEAAQAAANWANAQPNPEDAWSSGAY